MENDSGEYLRDLKSFIHNHVEIVTSFVNFMQNISRDRCRSSLVDHDPEKIYAEVCMVQIIS